MWISQHSPLLLNYVLHRDSMNEDYARVNRCRFAILLQPRGLSNPAYLLPLSRKSDSIYMPRGLLENQHFQTPRNCVSSLRVKTRRKSVINFTADLVNPYNCVVRKPVNKTPGWLQHGEEGNPAADRGANRYFTSLWPTTFHIGRSNIERRHTSPASRPLWSCFHKKKACHFTPHGFPNSVIMLASFLLWG